LLQSVNGLERNSISFAELNQHTIGRFRVQKGNFGAAGADAWLFVN
jgi:hypothetical protein